MGVLAELKFFAATQEGDLTGLEALLAHDVTLTGDGDEVPALGHSIHGREHVARTLMSWFRLSTRLPGASLQRAEINGAPGALIRDGQQGRRRAGPRDRR